MHAVMFMLLYADLKLVRIVVKTDAESLQVRMVWCTPKLQRGLL